MVPDTRYTKSGEIHIAYQVVGDGSRDVLYLPGIFAHIELQWEEPSYVRFLRRLSSFSRLIALDMRGKSLSSEDFAALLSRWRDEGAGDLAFAIGGAEGLDDTLCAAAALTLSLGAMTWPHMLVRVMLAEQLYRAQTILTGHPYHRA